MKRVLVAMSLCLGIGAVSANGLPTGPVPFKASARLVIDRNGVPQHAEASGQLPEPIRRVVEERVMAWRFEPLASDGGPIVGATHVFLEGCAMAQEDGSLKVALEYSRHGPGYANGGLVLPPPGYPSDALMRAIEGSFRVIVRVGADGHATLEKIERKRGELRLFSETLKNWVAALRYVPEEIDGVPVATRLSIPVSFSIDTRSDKQAAREQRAKAATSSACVTANKATPETIPVVLDSPFKPLRTS